MFDKGFIHEDPDDELKTIFDLMDQDNKGYINAKDMLQIFTENLTELNEKYFESLEKALDENQNENLDFEDFKNILRRSVLRDTVIES